MRWRLSRPCEEEKIVDAQSHSEAQEHTDDQRPDTHNSHHSQRIRESSSDCEFGTDFSESQQEWLVRKLLVQFGGNFAGYKNTIWRVLISSVGLEA